MKRINPIQGDDSYFNNYCPLDFREGTEVKIEIPEYLHYDNSVFREGVVLGTDVSVRSIRGENLALKLLVVEKFRGRKDRRMPRTYSYNRMRNAWRLK